MSFGLNRPTDLLKFMSRKKCKQLADNRATMSHGLDLPGFNELFAKSIIPCKGAPGLHFIPKSLIFCGTAVYPKTLSLCCGKNLHITQIHIAQPGALADVPGPEQGRHRGAGNIHEFVGRVEGAEVPGDIRGNTGNKFGQTAQFLCAVVQAGNDEGGYFQPHAELVQALHRFQHRREFGPADVAVEFAAKGFDVDIGGIEPFTGTGGALGGLLAHIAVADKDIGQPRFLGGEGAVFGKFKEDRGLGVGVADAPAASSLGHGDHLLGAAPSAHRFLPPGQLGEVVVLAVFAGKIAALGGDGPGSAAGQKVVERFFLDRISRFSRHLAIDQAVQLAVLIFPHPAQTALARSNQAMVAAEAAAQPCFFLGVEQRLPHWPSLFFPFPDSSPICAGGSQRDSQTCLSRHICYSYGLFFVY